MKGGSVVTFVSSVLQGPAWPLGCRSLPAQLRLPPAYGHGLAQQPLPVCEAVGGTLT